MLFKKEEYFSGNRNNFKQPNSPSFMETDLGQLAKFLVKAKVNAWAGDGKELAPQRPGFKELEFREGLWLYRDSYAGYFMAPGQEYVTFDGNPVWAMGYSGGMSQNHRVSRTFAKQTFEFLKKALKQVDEKRPFRGPKIFIEGDQVYLDESWGDITDFHGTEKIIYQDREVFKQNYCGGLIIPK